MSNQSFSPIHKHLTGHSLVDLQHTEVLEWVDQALCKGMTARCPSGFSRALGGLAATMDGHQAMEEAAMGNLGQPEKQRHIREHSDMLKALDDLREKARLCRDPSTLAWELHHLVHTWLSDHVCTLDRELAGALADGRQAI